MMESRLKELVLSSGRLHYIDEGSGTPVIFVHGDIQDYRTWEPQKSAFSEGFRFISYSRRYHYPNLWVGDGSDYSALGHAEDLAELIHTLNLAPAHIVGGSYGGLVALLLAVRHPTIVRTLVLNEPGLMPWLEHHPDGKPFYELFLSALAAARPIFQSGTLEEGLRAALDIFWGEGVFDQLPESTRVGALDNAAALKAEAFSPDLFSQFSREDAKQIQTPVLLVCGEATLPQFTLITDELEPLLMKKERINIPNAEHLMHIDNPEAYNEAVLSFLEKHG